MDFLECVVALHCIVQIAGTTFGATLLAIATIKNF